MQNDLAARYGEERLPRYTSYPPAPLFSDAVTAGRYAEWLESQLEGLTASLYLHVPFCRAMCWYCGCNTTVARRDGPIAEYVAVLQREIELVAMHTGPRAVNHIHFGGGTPTILDPHQLRGLMRLIRERFTLTEDAEIAIEIDPRTLTPAVAEALGESGFTRASLGVQSFDLEVQRAINRLQSFEQTAAATELLRAVGIGAINFDLLYGLPHQTEASCAETVRQCLELRPDRFSVFGYAHVPGFKKHQGKIRVAALPEAGARHAQAETVAQLLTGAGYQRIGLDHYALPGDPLAVAQRSGVLHRNFQGYTTDRSELLIGLGASAIGRLPQGYVQNEVVIGQYAERIAAGALATVRGYALSPDDRLRADLIERLMCDFRVDVGDVCAKHGVATQGFLQSVPRLGRLAADGVVRCEGSVITVTAEARFLIRSVAAAFDAYLGSSGRAHSRAV